MSEDLLLELPRPRIVNSLVLDEFPTGKVTRALVELVHDGLGRPIRIPTLVARGDKPGPVFGITAAVHGNELNGIPVIHRLFESLDPHTLRGSLVGVIVVNIPGLLMHQREFIDGHDLNDIMPGKPNGNTAQVYTHRFVDRVVRQFDYLVDLHTASFGRVNSLYVRADMTHDVTSEMAYLQRPQIIVHSEPSDGTLRGTAMDLDIPAITLEIRDPHRFQSESIKRSLTGVRAVLSHLGMLPKRAVALGAAPVVCSRSYWLYTDHGGFLEVHPELRDEVKAGDVIARLSSVYGDVVREYRAPEDGVVVGRSVNPVAQTGARIIHLGIVAPEDAPFRFRE